MMQDVKKPPDSQKEALKVLPLPSHRHHHHHHHHHSSLSALSAAVLTQVRQRQAAFSKAYYLLQKDIQVGFVTSDRMMMII